MNFRRPNARIIFFWLIQLGVLILVWNFLPNRLSAALLVILVLASLLFLAIKSIELAVITNVVLIITATQLWVTQGSFPPFWGTPFVVVGIVLTGLLAEQPSGRKLTEWLILGFATAQLASLTSYLPVAFFHKAILSGTFFYIFWQLFKLWDTDEPLLGHFVFGTLAVMVIIGSMIWTGLPKFAAF